MPSLISYNVCVCYRVLCCAMSCACLVQTWREKGRENLQLLLAMMGIPLNHAQAAYGECVWRGGGYQAPDACPSQDVPS